MKAKQSATINNQIFISKFVYFKKEEQAKYQINAVNVSIVLAKM
jgi:hypothetical protein